MKILFNNKLGLIFILLFSLSVKAEFRLGVDYTMVSNPMPVKQDGVVEVMESFWYGCNACYSFEPSINAWASEQAVSYTHLTLPTRFSV